MRSLGRKARTKRRLALPAPKKMAGSASSKKKCFSIIGRNREMEEADREEYNILGAISASMLDDE